jgi:hypothetical protein
MKDFFNDPNLDEEAGQLFEELQKNEQYKQLVNRLVDRSMIAFMVSGIQSFGTLIISAFIAGALFQEAVLEKEEVDDVWKSAFDE